MSGDNSLSFEARLALSEALLKLPDPQFKRLVFALNPPPGILPADQSALGDRAASLLQWVENNGPGLAVLQQALAQITGAAISSPVPPAPPPTPEPTPTGSIFISYRRDDSASDTGRIYDRLAHEFGRDNIFKDVDSIPLGVDFAQHIDQEVGRCQVLLVVIGKTWLTPRLQSPDDFVRLEIESALNRGIPVVPVFLEGVTGPPPRDQLPQSLQPLIRRNGTQVGQDPRFHADMGRLVKGLRDYFQQPNPPDQPSPAPSPAAASQTVMGSNASQVNDPTGPVFTRPMTGNTITINYPATTVPEPVQHQTLAKITDKEVALGAQPPAVSGQAPPTPETPAPASPLTKMKILILAANPKNTPHLRLDQEVRDIEEGLTRAQQRDRFELVQRWAARPRDVRRAILDLNPQIVHFSGHGEGEGGLALEDDQGQAQLVPTAALAGLFELFADQVQCVLLNACYSAVQGQAIAQHIPYVIGMKQAIGDTAAREFAVGFYDALGAGRDMEFAFRYACNSIQMAGLREDLTPVLLRGQTAQSSSGDTEKHEPKSTPQPPEQPLETGKKGRLQTEIALLEEKLQRCFEQRLLTSDPDRLVTLERLEKKLEEEIAAKRDQLQKLP